MRLVFDEPTQFALFMLFSNGANLVKTEEITNPTKLALVLRYACLIMIDVMGDNESMVSDFYDTLWAGGEYEPDEDDGELIRKLIRGVEPFDGG